MRNRFMLILVLTAILFLVLSCSFYTQTSIPDKKDEMIMIGHSQGTFAWLINLNEKTKKKMTIIGMNKEHYLWGITNAEEPDEYYITTFWGEFILYKCKKVDRKLYCKRITQHDVNIIEND